VVAAVVEGQKGVLAEEVTPAVAAAAARARAVRRVAYRDTNVKKAWRLGCGYLSVMSV